MCDEAWKRFLVDPAQKGPGQSNGTRGRIKRKASTMEDFEQIEAEISPLSKRFTFADPRLRFADAANLTLNSPVELSSPFARMNAPGGIVLKPCESASEYDAWAAFGAAFFSPPSEFTVSLAVVAPSPVEHVVGSCPDHDFQLPGYRFMDLLPEPPAKGTGRGIEHLQPYIVCETSLQSTTIRCFQSKCLDPQFKDFTMTQPCEEMLDLRDIAACLDHLMNGHYPKGHRDNGAVRPCLAPGCPKMASATEMKRHWCQVHLKIKFKCPDDGPGGCQKEMNRWQEFFDKHGACIRRVRERQLAAQATA